MSGTDYEVLIRSHSNYVGMRFHNPEYSNSGGLDYFAVDITYPTLSASARVYAYQGEKYLLRLFESMSESWKGWSGAKNWASLEGELDLRCTSDSLGHIEIKLLEPLFIKGWQLRGVALVESGQLGLLYKNMKQFINGGG